MDEKRKLLSIMAEEKSLRVHDVTELEDLLDEVSQGMEWEREEREEMELRLEEEREEMELQREEMELEREEMQMRREI